MLTKKSSVKNKVKVPKTPKESTASTPSSNKKLPAKTQNNPVKQAHQHSGNCCSSISETPAQQIAKSLTQHALNKTSSPTQVKNLSKTQIIIKYNAGYPNQLFIRGKGANLSWEKGVPLKNIKADEWTWETEATFTQCEFKILINDETYENGENHQLTAGSTLLYMPHFS